MQVFLLSPQYTLRRIRDGSVNMIQGEEAHTIERLVHLRMQRPSTWGIAEYAVATQPVSTYSLASAIVSDAMHYAQKYLHTLK